MTIERWNPPNLDRGETVLRVPNDLLPDLFAFGDGDAVDGIAHLVQRERVNRALATAKLEAMKARTQ